MAPAVGRGMTRLQIAKASRGRPQRRIVAAGARIRGQWRYLVRSTRDPFGESSPPLGEASSKRDCERFGQG
jgi:hypothetical protein